MSQTVALIPARSGSKGIPGKNFRKLGGKTLIQHAADCAWGACAGHGYFVHLTTDWDDPALRRDFDSVIRRPAALAQDDTPMYDVVKHAVETLKLADDDILLIVQPTQPFRKPEHLTTAVQMLRESGADSVVSVVPLPLTHASEFQYDVRYDGRLEKRVRLGYWLGAPPPTRRQDVTPAYIRDGTVYALHVGTLRSRTLYGQHVVPLILDPSDTCELDTEADWEAVTARWSAQHEAKHER